MTITEKITALLNTTENSDAENILKECTLDEMQKIAIALGLSPKKIRRKYWGTLEFALESEIIYTLISRRERIELERKWGKILAHDYNKTSNSIIELYQWGVENKFDMKALLRLAEEVLEKALTE